MATPYLREALRFIGVSDVRFARIGPTGGPAEPARLAREAAHRRLAEMAASFWPRLYQSEPCHGAKTRELRRVAHGIGLKQLEMFGAREAVAVDKSEAANWDNLRSGVV
jgi:hypothetical protein